MRTFNPIYSYMSTTCISLNTENSEIFARIYFHDRVKRHICDVKISRLGHDLPISVNGRMISPISRVGISGTTAKSRKRKFVPSSHPGPFAVVASSRKSQTMVGTLACFDFL